MKLIAGAILILALLELFLCAPMIGSDDGKYTETHTSSSWGYNAGLDANVGLEGGFKDSITSLGLKNHLGLNVGGHKENGQKDLNHAVTAAPPPNNFGSGFGSPYGMPNNPTNGSPYYIQYAPQPPSRYPPQFAPQPIQQYVPQRPKYIQQWPQYAPQQSPQVAPQYIPHDVIVQSAPQTAPQYDPQGAPQYTPQGAPQYDSQGAPKYAPQSAPQYAPQGAPQYAPQYALTKRVPNSSQRTVNEEDIQ